MIFGPTSLDQAEGAILGHSTAAGAVRFKKGRVLSSEDITALAEAGVRQVIAARLEDGDVHEDEAAARLAQATLGDDDGALNLSAAFTGDTLLIPDTRQIQFTKNRPEPFPESPELR